MQTENSKMVFFSFLLSGFYSGEMRRYISVAKPSTEDIKLPYLVIPPYNKAMETVNCAKAKE